MALPLEFLKARRAWLRVPPPVSNARQNRDAAPTYCFELELDHLVSSIRSYIDDLMTRRRWDHCRFAAEALETLSRLDAELNEITNAETSTLRGYVTLTRNLLEELSSIPVLVSGDFSREEARHELLAACEGLVNGELTVLEAAAIISRVRSEIDPSQDDHDLLAFAAIDSEEDHLMVVDSEVGWRPDHSEARRAEKEAAEAFHRSQVLDAARKLIHRYGRDSA